MRIVTEAEQRGGQIVEESKKQAEDDTQILSEADQTASQILDEARKKAKDNAQIVKREAARLLTTAKNKKIREDKVEEVFERIRQNLLSLAECLEKPPAISMKKTTVPEPPETEAARQVPIETITEEPQEQPAPDRDEGGNLDLFEGHVELALPPPLGLDQMLQIHKTMKQIPYVNVLNLGGSVDKGITIRIFVETPTPLLKVIGEMPEVDKTWEERPGDEKLVPSRQGGEEYPLRRIIMTAKRCNAK